MSSDLPNCDFDVTSKYIIHHFPQGTGCPGDRLDWMSKFLEDYRLYIKNKQLLTEVVLKLIFC
jgi:hypothetical protein